MICDDVENDKQKAHHVKEGLAAFVAEQPAAELVVKMDYVECYRKCI
jgi:hypothetical protein